MGTLTQPKALLGRSVNQDLSRKLNKSQIDHKRSADIKDCSLRTSTFYAAKKTVFKPLGEKRHSAERCNTSLDLRLGSIDVKSVERGLTHAIMTKNLRI